MTSLTPDTQDVGVSALSPSGDLNPGTISINGQREFANSFVVNGSDVEEDVNMGAAIVPNLDSIAEFRILTSNFDAEYGEFSGGQINVVTKSGTNAFHGDAFEFCAIRISTRATTFLLRVAYSGKTSSEPLSAARFEGTGFFSLGIIRERDRLREWTPERSRFLHSRTAPATSWTPQIRSVPAQTAMGIRLPPL